MEQTEFLEKNIFIDLKNLNESEDKQTVQHFSESDFEIVLQRVHHFGIGVYSISSFQNGEAYEHAAHDDFKKKATDSKWYKKAFLTFKSRNPGQAYSATYKVSQKLLSKNNTLDN
jgi:hypothetical protein